ncbi:MAG: TMEM165/GDT1 family protein [Jatrophihabitans sp.]|uniref:TMEM165/GDT1 family protein n=1 Tax=Jatrophihabitans sp. TaxID=1932789 RepID=UPI003F80DB5E
MATGLGAFVALVAVAVLAASLGRSLVKRIPLHLIHGVAGVLFAVFAVIAAVSAARG